MRKAIAISSIIGLYYLIWFVFDWWAVAAKCLAIDTGDAPTGAAVMAKFLICFMFIGVIGIGLPWAVTGIASLAFAAMNRAYDEIDDWLRKGR